MAVVTPSLTAALLLLPLCFSGPAGASPLSVRPLGVADRRPPPFYPSDKNNSRARPSGAFSSGERRRLEFGDYADHSFVCPATTTCPVVCVEDAGDCPEDARCEEGEDLCAGGTCASVGTCDVDLESPCECEALPVACAKKVDLYDTCFDRFQGYYDANNECIEAQEDALPSVSFTGPWFLASYVYIGAITGFMLLWCACNQRFFPVANSTRELESATRDKASSIIANNDDANLDSGWTQTGYKDTIIGTTLYGLVILTHLLIQVLLLILTIYYYMQQEAITRWEPVFYDEVEVLMAFEIVWMVGFIWCFFLKYPASIKSLFLRRCIPSEATYVAVHAPVRSVDPNFKQVWIIKMLSCAGRAFVSVLQFLYSDKAQQSQEGMRIKVTFCRVRNDEFTGTRYFYFRMRRYIYDEASDVFIPGSLNTGDKVGDLLSREGGLSTDEARKHLGLVGPNVLDLTKPTVFGCIRREFSKPFYLYQNFMVWTWAPYWYYYMAIVHTIVRMTGGVVVAIFQYINDSNLYKLMVVEGSVEVLRDGSFVELSQVEVVPGDVVRLRPGLTFCDMAIVRSKHLLVDESALTGEVHPVAKVELDHADSASAYHPKTHKSSTISAGTTVIECSQDGSDIAVATKTGSFTAKGELLCDVLSYERHKFKFDTEVKLVLIILACEAIVLFALVVKFLEDQWVYGWFYGMFVVSTALPPLLPTVFVVSVGISSKRLQEKRITCTDSRGILVAGKVRRACFDKTGTLTKQGLDFLRAEKGPKVTDDELERGMAVCHTLDMSNAGDLVGTTVDSMSFKAASATLEHEDGRATGVVHSSGSFKYLKRFTFDHHSMTQSVVVERVGLNDPVRFVYVKGSPEAIRAMCEPGTLPDNFEEKARDSAREGVYQIAMALGPFTVDVTSAADISRGDVEKMGLTFAGFISFENAIKEDTVDVIQQLTAGDVSSTMITGDNVLTGIHVAKQAGLINKSEKVIIGNRIVDGNVEWIDASNDEVVSDADKTEPNIALALTGEAWSFLFTSDPKAATEIARLTRVFGRCTPNDKVSIVQNFVQEGEITLMCGDGGNDVGALKTAHVGIALSDAEASVVAPFTSLDKTISSVPEVLKEGRCALASALAAYKYMIMYGQVETINQVANAYLYITFTDWCWVFMDGIWAITMAFTLPLAKAAKKLSPKRPTASLLGPHTMSSACGVLAINFLFLVIALLALWNQDWFQCRKWESVDVSNIGTIGDNYETSVIFIVTGYQYVSSAAAYNFGYTYRAAWIKNYVFVAFFALWTLIHFIATVYPSRVSCIFRVNCYNENAVRFVTESEPDAINNPFNTTLMPVSFRWILFVILVLNLMANMMWEYFVVNGILARFGKKIGLAAMDNSMHGRDDRVLPENDFENEEKDIPAPV